MAAAVFTGATARQTLARSAGIHAGYSCPDAAAGTDDGQPAVKFVQAHPRGENGVDGILKAEAFRQRHTAPLGGDYGYGWIIATRPWAAGKVLTHAGSNTLSFAVVWAVVMKNFGAVVVTNQGRDDAGKACDEAAAANILERIKGR